MTLSTSSIVSIPIGIDAGPPFTRAGPLRLIEALALNFADVDTTAS